MVTSPTTQNAAPARKAPPPKRTSANGSAALRSPAGTKRKNVRNGRQSKAGKLPKAPSWLGAVLSVVGGGIAIGAGLYATRRQWMPQAEAWRENFSAAFADNETDTDNFDQTRHAGRDSMRDDPGSDWEDIDDMSDASFPASDPPSFNPGTA